MSELLYPRRPDRTSQVEPSRARGSLTQVEIFRTPLRAGDVDRVLRGYTRVGVDPARHLALLILPHEPRGPDRREWISRILFFRNSHDIMREAVSRARERRATFIGTFANADGTASFPVWTRKGHDGGHAIFVGRRGEDGERSARAMVIDSDEIDAFARGLDWMASP